MTKRRTDRHLITWTLLAAMLWVAVSIPSGFSVVQIAMFIGPGIVLAIAVSWASHAAFPDDWTWQHGLRAAAVGAGAFPPFVAAFFAWAGTFGSSSMVTLLVFSAWLAVLFGLVLALGRLALAPKEKRHRASATRALTRRASSASKNPSSAPPAFGVFKVTHK